MSGWLENLRPDEYVATIHEIDLDRLWDAGYRVILTDLDNTLVPWNDPEVSKELQEWLARATAKGFKVSIVSNNKGPRVQAFAQKAGLDFVAAARKPKIDAFVKAVDKYAAKREQTIMIGDQLFTDIQGGNRCGIHTILVLPIREQEWWGTQVVRRIERIAMKMLVRRGLVVPERRVNSK